MVGRAIVLSTGTTIAPFGDPVSKAFFAGETLDQTQDRAFRCAGLEVVRVDDVPSALEAASAPGPHLLTLDRVFLSEKAVKDFLRAAKEQARPAALSLSMNASVDYALPLQNVRREGDAVIHDVVLVDGAPANAGPLDDSAAWLRRVAENASPVEVPKREIVVEVPMPVLGKREDNILRYPITSTVVVSIEHWVHILWLNQIAFGIRWMELIRRHPFWAAWRAFTAFSFNKFKVLDRLVRKGRGTTIHPTAQVSGSILGNNVQVGPHVSIRNSIIADGAVLQDHATLVNSVVGQDVLITENTFMVSCAVYPKATVGNYKIQVSLVGQEAYLHPWASFVDAKFVGAISVQHQGQLVSTERAFLGSVVGHRAQIAAKVLIQPGREIPNDTVVVMRPDEVVSEVPSDLPKNTPLVRDKGTLVKLGEETRTP